jgi:hypothetical protein
MIGPSWALIKAQWKWPKLPPADDAMNAEHVIDNEIAREEKTIFGTRYVVDGVLKAPDGRPLNVRTVWFIDDDGDAPRFVTAHPLRRRRS